MGWESRQLSHSGPHFDSQSRRPSPTWCSTPHLHALLFHVAPNRQISTVDMQLFRKLLLEPWFTTAFINDDLQLDQAEIVKETLPSILSSYENICHHCQVWHCYRTVCGISRSYSNSRMDEHGWWGCVVHRCVTTSRSWENQEFVTLEQLEEERSIHSIDPI